MQWPTFKTKLRKALESNTILGLVCLGLLFIAVLQQIKINSQHERITLKPPSSLSEEVIIGWDHASQEYLNSFALYIVGSMSSATPNTVDYTANGAPVRPTALAGNQAAVVGSQKQSQLYRH